MGIRKRLITQWFLFVAVIAVMAYAQPPYEMMKDWPNDNIGTLYAKIKPPDSLDTKTFTKRDLNDWYRVKAWGQLCDGTDQKKMVHLMLYNDFPNHGKGWTYLEWECKPDNSLKCKYPIKGKVNKIEPYNGIAFK
jgi:hypothetical protein